MKTAAQRKAFYASQRKERERRAACRNVARRGEVIFGAFVMVAGAAVVAVASFGLHVAVSPEAATAFGSLAMFGAGVALVGTFIIAR